MAVDAVGLVAVQPAEQRTLVENRHRRLGLAVELHDGGIQLLLADSPDVGHDPQRSPQHDPLDDRVILAERTPRGRQTDRGDGTRHIPFQHKIRTFIPQKYDFPGRYALFIANKQ